MNVPQQRPKWVKPEPGDLVCWWPADVTEPEVNADGFLVAGLFLEYDVYSAGKWAYVLWFDEPDGGAGVVPDRLKSMIKIF